MKQKENLMKVIVPVLSILVAFIIGGIIMICLGKNPFQAYGFLFSGAFGSSRKIAQTLVIACPLIFTGLTAAFSYKCGVFNLGGEGQFVMGAVASIFFVTKSGIGGIAGILLSLLIGAAAGAVWGAIPGILKITRGLNEMIVSIMLNYVASFPVHWGVWVALFLAFAGYYFLFYTSKGFKLRAVGLNSTAAFFNGFPVNRYVLFSFIASGAVAGLGGSVELHGKQLRLMGGFGQGFGFDGVAIALIAQLNPIGTAAVAFIFAVLRKGASTLQTGMQIPTAVVDIIQALVIIFAVAGTALLKLPAIRQYINSHMGKKEVTN